MLLVLNNLLLAISIGASVFVLPPANSQSPMTVTIAEGTLRKSALKQTMPSYPEDSKKRGAQGVSVIEIEHNKTGDVVRWYVHEVPDAVIRQALIDAVKQWKFSAKLFEGEAVHVRGKLTFYYRIDERGEARVENPRQYQ